MLPGSSVVASQMTLTKRLSGPPETKPCRPPGDDSRRLLFNAPHDRAVVRIVQGGPPTARKHGERDARRVADCAVRPRTAMRPGRRGSRREEARLTAWYVQHVPTESATARA